MLPILWLPSARDDLRQIITYIAKENPPAARRLKIRIETSVLPLSEHPYLYPPSERVSGLREIVTHPNYIILYRVAASSIEIVSVTHSRRQFPFSIWVEQFSYSLFRGIFLPKTTIKNCWHKTVFNCRLHTPTTHPAPQNAGQYFELPSSGQGLSSQPEAYEHDGGNTLYNSAAGF